jgi:hypothetical protein
MLGKIILLIALVLVAGCAAVWEDIQRDPRDAAWDPKAGAQLFEQLPAWDSAAARICCGALLGDRAAYRAERCDTAQPRLPRSNRC